MEIFEIHITGNKYIHEVGRQLGIKTIEIELLNPKKEIITTEHMTSIVHQSENYLSCKKYVDKLVNQLLPCNVTRVKIECPWYEQYLKDTVYVESHFPPLFPLEIMPPIWPMSRNVKSGKMICTLREYKELELFKYWCMNQSLELEMCVYDTNVNQDNYWFETWRNNNG